MNFQKLLSKLREFSILNEARTPGSGHAERMERHKSKSGDYKSRDAARKRVERSRAIPRDKKSKAELLKEIILVKTKSGRIQLIFKDSYNPSYHEKMNDKELSMEEAQQASQSPEFEQTRASKLLLSDVKKHEHPAEHKHKKHKESSGEERPKQEPKEADEEPKAKRLSKEQMFQSMSQMTPEQLVGMPPELRIEYFRMTRKPIPNMDFDNMSFENLSDQYGLSTISSLPYNQQVLNALMFLGKIKVGSGQQELQTFMMLAPDVRDFTKSAYFTAKKILSQIGDQCLQMMVSNVETSGKPVSSDGMVDMECGNYKFKIAAGGEMSMSSTQFDQSNKNFKRYVGVALTQVLSNPQVISNSKSLTAIFQKMQQGQELFSKMLVPDQMLPQIMQDENLVKELQKMQITDPQGKVVGTVLDEEGNLNQLASLDYYTKAWEDGAKEITKGSAKNALKAPVLESLLKTILRGDGLIDPQMAPNHLVTINGIIPLTDEYFNLISKQSSLDVNPSKDIMSSSNITNYKPSAAEMLKKFTVVVEAKKTGIDLNTILIPRDSINPIQIMTQFIVKNNDFSMNASLLPGFNPKDLNAVQYNYITIGKKTVKIPVMKGENITNEVMGESTLFLNDVLVEALTNNFVLSTLVKNSLLSELEASFIVNNQNLLTEDSDYMQINVKSLYERATERMYDNPYTLLGLIDDLVVEEHKRNYRKEYDNYHGKTKQRKERIARTLAREAMKKKGLVKKGDGKDVDHKKPLRKGGSKGLNNLRVRDRSDNRSDNGHHKGEKQKKDWK